RTPGAGGEQPPPGPSPAPAVPRRGMASLDRISRRGNPAAPPRGASSGHWPAVPHLSPHGGQLPGANSKIFFPAHKCRVLETLLRGCPAPVPPAAKDREPL